MNDTDDVNGMERIGGVKVENPVKIFDSLYAVHLSFQGTTTGEEEQEGSDVNVLPAVNYSYEYSRDIAAFLSQVSGWSYADIRTFKNKLSWMTIGDDETVLAHAYYHELNVQNEALLIDSTAQFILSHDRSIAIISFRGTEITNPWNWFIDATTKKAPFFSSNSINGNNCKVHVGFKRNLETVWYGADGILSKLLAQEQNVQVIYITGHSLGGAMAVLAGLSLQEQQPALWNKVRGIYTYGQPMVVDNDDRDELERRVGHRLFRHVYFNDIVPHLPPLSVGPYDHSGKEYRYYPGDSIGWQLRTPPLLNIGKDRATQVLFAMPTLLPLGYDLILDNIEVKLPFTTASLKLPKSPWSLADHNPSNYMEHW